MAISELYRKKTFCKFTMRIVNYPGWVWSVHRQVGGWLRKWRGFTKVSAACRSLSLHWYACSRAPYLSRPLFLSWSNQLGQINDEIWQDNIVFPYHNAKKQRLTRPGGLAIGSHVELYQLIFRTARDGKGISKTDRVTYVHLTSLRLGLCCDNERCWNCVDYLLLDLPTLWMVLSRI